MVEGGREKLTGEVVKISSCPLIPFFPPLLLGSRCCFRCQLLTDAPVKPFSIYLFAQLFHAGGDLEWRSKTVKTQHTEGEGADVMWHSQFEWDMIWLFEVRSFK
jgi:phosphatidylinositol phospholipase C, delta